MKNLIKPAIRNIAYLLSLTIFLLTPNTSAYAQNTSFSGEWKLVKERSELGVLPDSVVAQNIHVVQSTDITITRNFLKPSGKASYSEKIVFNGPPSESAPQAGLRRVAKIQWSQDKTQLIENASNSGTIDGEAYEFKSTETWSLSADKKQLIIDRELVDGEETVKNHLVYEKQ